MYGIGAVKYKDFTIGYIVENIKSLDPLLYS